MVCGAVIVAGQGFWAWPGAMLTGLGRLLGQGLISLVAPDKALRSMAFGARSPRGFVAGVWVMLALGG